MNWYCIALGWGVPLGLWFSIKAHRYWKKGEPAPGKTLQLQRDRPVPSMRTRHQVTQGISFPREMPPREPEHGVTKNGTH